MYEYPLSTIHKGVVETWLSNKDKPLFIRGDDGCGKSTLSKNILKNYHIVEINSYHLKHSNIEDTVKSSLFKKNILMMCSGNHYKALLIDDLQLFISYDKTNLKKIYNLLKTIDYSKYPTIIVCNMKTHKYINMINNVSYTIILTHNTKFYKSIISSENKLSTTKLNKIIKASNNNLHTMKINVSLKSDKDSNFTIDEVINILFTKGLTIPDIYRYVSSEYNIISLNILENVSRIIKKNYISTLYSIYDTICIGDYVESKYLDKDIDIDIILFFLCICPYIYSKENININNYKYKYNSYIGRSIIQINNQSILSTSTIDYIQLLTILYKLYISPQGDYSINNYAINNFDINKIISQDNFDIKILEKQIKLFNYYYNKTMNKKQLNKILKSIK